LVNDGNDEVSFPPALSKIGDPLCEVERGVARNARTAARCSFDRDDALGAWVAIGSPGG
jgi:hypothetical protein